MLVCQSTDKYSLCHKMQRLNDLKKSQIWRERKKHSLEIWFEFFFPSHKIKWWIIGIVIFVIQFSIISCASSPKWVKTTKATNTIAVIYWIVSSPWWFSKNEEKKNRKRILCITNVQHELQQMFYSLISSFFFSSSLLFKMHQSVCTCCFKRHFILNCILLKWRMRKPNGPKENIKTDRFASNSNSHEIEKRNSVQHNIQCSNWVEKKNVIRPITY